MQEKIGFYVVGEFPFTDSKREYSGRLKFGFIVYLGFDFFLSGGSRRKCPKQLWQRDRHILINIKQIWANWLTPFLLKSSENLDYLIL